MPSEPRKTTVQIPIFISHDRHVVGTAEILEEEDDVTINISATAKGGLALDLAALMTSGELMGVRFAPLPVTRRTTSLRKDI